MKSTGKSTRLQSTSVDRLNKNFKIKPLEFSPSICTLNTQRKVNKPTHCSQRAGSVIPGAVAESVERGKDYGKSGARGKRGERAGREGRKRGKVPFWT